MELNELIRSEDGATALYMALTELNKRYEEAEKVSGKVPESNYKTGYADALSHAIEVINNRITMVNAPYEDNDEN
jgi:hypothetical protein